MSDIDIIEADVVVAGGGPAGATLALALAAQDCTLDVCVIEPRGAALPAQHEGRALALSHGSRLILERIGVWAALDAVTPITHIDISQRGGFGRACLGAEDAGVPALGYMVAYGALARALDAALAARAVRVLRGHALAHAYAGKHAVALQLEPTRDFSARLMVLADGGANAGLADVQSRDYHQIALSCEIVSEVPHRNRAFERFTPAGPIALLPHPRGWSLVWIASSPEAERLAVLEAGVFCAALKSAFGSVLGSFTLQGERRTFPLVLKYATAPRQPRTVLLGAAAQTLHPVAGQGLNLGLRDAWELARTLVVHAGEDAGDDAVLARYRAHRRRDRIATTAFTDTLIRLFCNDIPVLRNARGLGLAIFDNAPPIKRYIARRMVFGARGG